jgi:hypothetical protein
MFTYLSIFTMLSAISSLRMFKDKNLDGSVEVHFSFTLTSARNLAFELKLEMGHARYDFVPPGCLGSSPDPGCEFPAFISPTNTGERSMCSL